MARTLPVGEHTLDSLHVASVKHLSQTKRPLALGGLLGQDVARVGLVELELAGTGFFEALCSSSVCLNLRHGVKNLFRFVGTTPLAQP